MHWALSVGALSVSRAISDCQGLLLSGYFSPLWGDSRVQRVETLKGHTCSWTDLLSKRRYSVANHLSFNSNQTTWRGCGVHTKQIHSYNSSTLACRNDREQDTITPWNKCKTPYTSSFSIIITSEIKASITITIVTELWDKGVCEQAQNHPIMWFSILRALTWHPSHLTMPWLLEKFLLILQKYHLVWSLPYVSCHFWQEHHFL